MVAALALAALWNAGAVALTLFIRRRPRPRKALGRLALACGALFTFYMLVAPLLAVGGILRLFGTVGGEEVDPSQKARVLAEGISEAMNCAAFGILMFAVPTVVSLVIFMRSPKESHESHAPAR